MQTDYLSRTEMWQRVMDRHHPWDIVVIGGGATGAGIAVDAAARGYSVVLLERADFGSGTSSRSTKLVHGGVRYLRQGHIGLVLGALRERARLRRNAPHVVDDLRFVLPCYRGRDQFLFGIGLKFYDLLAGREGFGRSIMIPSWEVRRHLPTVRTMGLHGGVMYHDGQFDDARLLIHLLLTAVGHGATLLNYAPVVAVTRIASGTVSGVIARDVESGTEYGIEARVVINAAGPFCDEVRHLSDPKITPLVAASQGSHIVLDRSFLPGDAALLIPNTPDGRVLFAIPWHGHTLVGTTDIAKSEVPVEPRATEAEVDFILETAGRYFNRQPQRNDVLSTFAGIRPLVKGAKGTTAALSRDHLIHVEPSRLITITGGKWTTYRSMAEDCVTRAAEIAGLPRRRCRTRDLPIHRYPNQDEIASDRIHAPLSCTESDIVRAVRIEMARTVEDILARRTRTLFLNATAAIEVAPRVAAILARELGRDQHWIAAQLREFEQVARGFLPPSA